jgi:hypothetical protein
MKKWKKIIIYCSILLFFVIIGITLYWYYNSNETSNKTSNETSNKTSNETSNETSDKIFWGPKNKVEWQDPQCYEKCMDGCKRWSCWAECTLICKTPKYENCISKCKDLEVDWYDEQHYRERFSENEVWSKNRREYDERFNNNLFEYYALPEQYKYNERIEETFSWYIEKIEKYESCKSPCWVDPRVFI